MILRRFASRSSATTVAVVALLAAGCNEDKDSRFVAISGYVSNIDTLDPAQGVVVSLLGDGERFHSYPTGSDGLFRMEVPKGTAFEFVTNDFEGLDSDTVGTTPCVANDWITLINVDPVLRSIEEDIEVVIHACPTPESSQAWLGGTQKLGSVAIWQNFLENSSTASEYTTAPNVWGRNLTFIHLGTPPNDDLGVSLAHIVNVSVENIEKSFGKLGYWDVNHCFNFAYPTLENRGVQDPAVGPDIFIPGATANGPGISLVTGFANEDYSSDFVTLMLSDANPNRSIDFSGVSPVLVPLRQGATTMVTLGAVDNRIAPLTEGMCAGELTNVGCDQ
ncbi:MAG: hypothetical protein R3E12_18510 [Candidatus Eisenbacteria bacterium]